LEEQFNFDEIRPYRDHEVKEVMGRLLKNPTFLQLLKYIYPQAPSENYQSLLGDVNSVDDFQRKISHPAMRLIVDKTTTALTFSGIENLNPKKAYTFVSNHRDIILDSALLSVILIENGFSTNETAIGDNLLKDDVVKDLTKLNKNFEVKRNTSKKDFFINSLRMSAYIIDSIVNRHVSIWIAQREGRTKDGIDKTQPGLIKMLGLNGKDHFEACYKSLNISPMAISYEFDPCDVMKINEQKLTARNEKYTKADNEDYNSIIAGITGNKGRIHLAVGQPINSEIDVLGEFQNVNDKIKMLCDIIDKSVYKNYKLWPTN
jgi:Acyltransferase